MPLIVTQKALIYVIFKSQFSFNRYHYMNLHLHLQPYQLFDHRHPLQKKKNNELLFLSSFKNLHQCLNHHHLHVMKN
jgi:hypothetical protein